MRKRSARYVLRVRRFSAAFSVPGIDPGGANEGKPVLEISGGDGQRVQGGIHSRRG